MAEIDDLVVVDDNNTARWPEGMPASSVNNAGRADEGILARWYKDTNGNLVSTGAANAYTIALNRDTLTTIADGFPFTFEANFANTGACTITVTSGATTLINALPLVKYNDVALESGDIELGQKVQCSYDEGASTVQMLSPVAGIGNTSNLAKKDEANVFTQNQTVQSSDAGAAAGPSLLLDRDSASPAANDLLGLVSYQGNDAGTNDTIYAAHGAEIIDPTDTSEDGRFLVRTIIAGTEADRLYVGAGAYTAGATGGDQGADTINASEYYQDGTRFAPWSDFTSVDLTNGGANDLNFVDLDVTTPVANGATEIEIFCVALSPNGNNSEPNIRLGDAGGIETTGYTAVADDNVGVSAFTLTRSATFDSGDTCTLHVRLTNVDGNTWVERGTVGNIGQPETTPSMGSKTTSEILTTVRFFIFNSAFEFDSGTLYWRAR